MQEKARQICRMNNEHLPREERSNWSSRMDGLKDSRKMVWNALATMMKVVMLKMQPLKNICREFVIKCSYMPWRMYSTPKSPVCSKKWLLTRQSLSVLFQGGRNKNLDLPLLRAAMQMGAKSKKWCSSAQPDLPGVLRERLRTNLDFRTWTTKRRGWRAHCLQNGWQNSAIMLPKHPEVDFFC